MSSYDDDERKREERKRIVREIRERTAEAVTGHTMSDDESELAQLGLDLEREQEALERLAHTDPIGLDWFGHDDAWVDKRLHPNTRQ